MRRPSPNILFQLVFLLLCTSSFAQSGSTYCSSTAMVPVFKQDFGQGASSGTITTAPAGSTNYIFGSVSTDGRYIVTPKVENAGKADWTRGSDHTGNTNGNLFLVNAGGAKSIFLQQTVTGLCSGSSYSFSAWLANVNTSETKKICGSGLVYPKITFKIRDLSNTLLATYTTGNLPLSPTNGPVNWQKYGFQFDLPASTGTLKIEIVDFWGGADACGNDVALDDILFEACIPQISIQLNKNTDNICVGSSANMQSTLINSPYTNHAYQWQKSNDGGSTWTDMGNPGTGAGSNTYNFSNAAITDSGLYRVNVAPSIPSLVNETCSAHSNGISFQVNPLPQVLPTTNAPICSGKDLLLNANASGGSGIYTDYRWTGTNSFQSSKADTAVLSVKTNASGTYNIQVTDSKGCSTNSDMYIQIDSTPVIKVTAIRDTICSGATGLVSVNSSVANSAYYWSAALLSGSVTGNIAAVNPDPTGTQQSLLYNTGIVAGKIRYSVYALAEGNCKSNTIDSIITVLPIPTTAVAGNDTSICSGTTLLLNANTAVVGSGSWQQISGPASVVFSDNTNPTATIAGLVPGNFSFVWTIQGIQCGTSSDTMNLFYMAAPVTDFIMSDTAVCGPATILLTNNTHNKNNYRYLWNFGNGTNSALADPAAVNYVASISGADTAYTVTLKAYSNCDTVTTTQTIIVKQKPVAAFSATPGNTCLPLTVEFINRSAGSNAVYQLFLGDGTDTTISNNSTLLYTYRSLSSMVYQPLLIASNSCGADSASTTINATANTLTVQNNFTDSTICGAPYTANFNNTTTGATQFTWSWGDGSAATSSTSASGVQHTFQDSGVYLLSLRILHACGDTTITKTIQVFPIPTTAVAGNDTSICSGTTLLLNANTAVVGSGSWQQISGPASVVFSDNTNPTATIAGLVPGNFSFVWTIQGIQCGTSSDTMNLFYMAAPVTDFIMSDTAVCGPATILLTNNTHNKNNYRYLWNFGNGTNSALADPAAVNYVASISGADTAYTVTLKAYSNCDTVTTTQTIIVKSKAKIEFTAIPQNACLPVVVLFINRSAGTNTSYKLIFDDGKDSVINASDSVLHFYQNSATTLFHPMLIASGSCGTDTISEYIQAIANKLIIQNSWSDTAVCGAPFTYTFNNQTTGINNFTWSWGDGNTTTTTGTGMVQHTFQQPGNYTIKHLIQQVCGDTTITRQIHIYAGPQAAIAALPDNKCMGDSMLFKSLSDSSMQLEWKINDSTIGHLPEQPHAFSRPGNYTVQLIATKINPYKTCTDSIARQLLIVAVKPGKASITPLNGYCIPFTAELINQSQPASLVQWSLGNRKIATGDTASYTFVESGNFKITMSAVNAGGCTFTDSATVQVKSPTGTISFKGGLYCNSNNNVLFQPNVFNTDSIEWNFGDGTIFTTAVKSVSHLYKKEGIYYPSFVMISKTGCRIPVAASDSVIIESVKAYFKVTTLYDCGLTTFKFNDSSLSLSGINNYQWYLNRTFIGTGNNASASFKQTGTQETNLIITSNHGCTDSIRGAYNVSIYSFPQVSINSINEACLNNLMELRSDISSIDSVIYRLWNLGNGQHTTDSTVKILYFDEGFYTVKLTAATVNRCYDSAVKRIAIHPVPVIRVAASQRICNGDSIVLRANGAINYVWKDQQENIICNNCLTVNVKPATSTQYKVIGYNEYGCTQVAGTKVQVIDPPNITIAPESVICEGTSVRIWASGGSSYQWMPAPGLNNYSSASPIASPAVTTTYKVIAKDPYNCFTDTAYTRVVVGKPTPIKVSRDTVFVAGASIRLMAKPAADNIVQWKWSGGSDLSCVYCPDPVARVIYDETIICKATNVFGCVTSDTIQIKTFCPGAEVFFPNAFTPDGDGVNDIFYVQAKGIRIIKNLRIYNRWGEVVFEKSNFQPNDKSAGWNGRIRGNLANPDVFIYISEMVCEKGSSQMYKGNVAVIQ